MVETVYLNNMQIQFKSLTAGLLSLGRLVLGMLCIILK